MATLELAGTAAIPSDALDRVYAMRNIIDFSVNNANIADVVQVLAVPAYTHVTRVLCRIKTVGTTSGTATVGHGGAASGWDASVALDAAVGTVTQSLGGTDTYGYDGHTYTAADTIDLTIAGANMVVGVVEVIALCIDLN